MVGAGEGPSLQWRMTGCRKSQKEADYLFNHQKDIGHGRSQVVNARQLSVALFLIWHVTLIKKPTVSLWLQCFYFIYWQNIQSRLFTELKKLISSERKRFFCHTIFCDNTDDNRVTGVNISLSCGGEYIFHQEYCFIFCQRLFCYSLLVLKSNLKN